MKKYLQEPILKRALVLTLMFVAALLIISATYAQASLTSLKYQNALENQRAHEDLGNRIITKLILLEGELNQLAYVEDERDLRMAQQHIDTLLEEIMQIVQVLREGGTFTEELSSNLVGLDELKVAVSYELDEEAGYFVEVLELVPRLLDVQDTSLKLSAAVERKLAATNVDEQLASDKEIELLLKQVDTFFVRSQESANRIYFESHIKMDEIAAARIESQQRVGVISLVVVLMVVGFGGSVARHELQQIRILIDERSHTEKLLRDAELRYRTVADFTYAWEYWRNPDGELEYVSPSCERVTGYAQAEIFADPDIIDTMICKEDELVWLKHGSETNKKHGPQEIRFRVCKKNGDVVWIEHACQPVISPTGEFVGFRASNRDVTSRVEAQNALREREGLYRSLVENSPIGIVLSDLTGNILSVNQVALNMLGSPSSEATKSINLLTFAPLVANGFVKDFYASIESEKPVWSTAAYVSKWGVHINSRYGLTSVYDAQGELFGVQILLEDITEQMRDKADLQRQIRNFATINTINNAILTRTDLEGVTSIILREIVERLGVDAADVLIYDEHALTLTCSAREGFNIRAAEPIILRVGDGYAGQAAVQRKTVRLRDINDPNLNHNIPKHWKDEAFLSYFGVPLLVKGELKGILELYQRSNVERDKSWLEFMETLAQQVAIAIDSHFLLDALQRSNMELELAYETTLEGWAHALEMRDYETKGHTERVAALTVKLAQSLGAQREELTHIRRGALLHDIGKIAVSDTILLKEGPCTAEEWEIIKQHPYFGYEMLRKITYLKPSLDIVLYHHERWDGAGYPEGLAGERIPYAARIFAVVDVWDALINDRPYHDAWSREETLKHIQDESGKHFDPQVVEVFCKIILEEE